MKKKFAFLINYGIEYRNFFLSGLSSEIVKKSDTVVFKRDIESSNFEEYTENFDLNIVNINRSIFNKKRHRLENVFQSVRQSRMRVKKIGIFKNYNAKTNKTGVKDYIKGNVFVYSMLKFLVLKQIRQHYADNQIQDVLLKDNITDVIISGYSSTGSIAFAVNAMALDINVWILVNSWKDIYINEFIPFNPTGIFVWSNEMKENYLALNSHLKSEQIFATGNPIFDRFYQYSAKQSRNYYEKKYNIHESRAILLYSMLDPDRYPEEIEVIKMIGDALVERYSEEVRPYILIRRNPFNESEHIVSYFKDHPCIRIADHYSQRDKVNDFFVQSIEGEDEWMDLLYYSSLNMGAASTVALEAIMLKKPVITIAFDHLNKSSELLRTMADAPFYKAILEREDVSLVNNCNECVESVSAFIGEQKALYKLPIILNDDVGTAVENIITIMENK